MPKDKNKNKIKEKIKEKIFIWRDSKRIDKLFARILLALAIIFLGALCIDIIGREFCLKILEGCLPSQVTDLLKVLSPNEVNDIVDAFNGIWGITITIAIFIFEIGGTYQYGITLRHIAAIRYKTRNLILIVIAYLLIYPAIYLCKSNNCKLAAFILLMGAYVGLVWLLWFTFTQSRADEIKKLLIMKTKNTLSNKEKNDSDIRSQLGKLEIINVIEHIDYTDVGDIEELIDTLKQIATDEELLQNVDNTYIKQLLIMVWVGRIINKSGIDSGYKVEQTVALLLRLWYSFIQGLPLELKEKLDNEEFSLSYSVQMLLPFVDLGDKTALKAMMLIWEQLSVYLDATVVYILLYMEFQNYFFEIDETDDINELKKISRKFIHIIKNFEKNNSRWNKELGLKLWMAWGRYKLYGDNVGLAHFEDFCNDIDKLKCEGHQHINMTTYIMQYIAILLREE